MSDGTISARSAVSSESGSGACFRDRGLQQARLPLSRGTFAILALTAWELLLKARLLAAHGSDPKCLYVYEARTGKKGRPTRKRYRKRNRSGNFQALGLGATIVALERQGIVLDPGNPKSPNKDFLNPQILDEFDKHYSRRDSAR